ncbi:MAG: methionyl-tRNA formyltransferase [Candidatus Baltobacteraceae bacterium]
MRSIFFGTSAFAVPSLHALADATECALVVTQPDRPSGRGQKLHPTPVKRAARERGLATLEPQRLRESEADLRAAAADVFVVASYGKIVPQAILDLPPSGALNVHPSLLTLYRGATPLQSQIRDGVVESGITIIWMDAGMDTGDIALAERSPIGARETYGALHDRFATLGATALGRALRELQMGTLRRSPQCQAGIAGERIAATLTRPLHATDLLLDWTMPANDVVNKVRSLAPAPGAKALLEAGQERPYKILEARVASAEDLALDPRQVSGPIVPCGGAEFVVLECLVPPDRRAMSGREFLQWRRT